MRFLRAPRPGLRNVALFCGAFHPPTVAHIRLSEAARMAGAEVVWVMPERLPHKRYDRVSLPQRLRLVLEATKDPVAVSQEQFFFAIAQEAQDHLPQCQIKLLLGEDGAERLFNWDYGLSQQQREQYLQENLSRYPLQTTWRAGLWQPPAWAQRFIEWLHTPEDVSGISSTLVRQRIEAAEDWEELVPESIRERVRNYYISGKAGSGQ